MIDEFTFACVVHFFVTAVVLKLLGLILPLSISWYYTFIAHVLLFFYIAKFTFEYVTKEYLTLRIQSQNGAVSIADAASNINPSAFSEFQMSQTVNHLIQNKGLSLEKPAITPAFRTNSGNLAFGNKTENVNQREYAVFQATVPKFRCPSTSPVVRNHSAPVSPEMPNSERVTFRFEPENPSAFELKSEEKKQSVSNGLSIQILSKAETSNTFQDNFNRNPSPAGFKFGVCSTPSRPFQFGYAVPASSNFAHSSIPSVTFPFGCRKSRTSQTSDPRKIRKAVRKLRQKDQSEGKLFT